LPDKVEHTKLLHYIPSSSEEAALPF